MKKLIVTSMLGLILALAGNTLLAAGQQSKMKGCNQEAKEMGVKGDERKAFMKKCLSKNYQLKSDKSAGGTPAAGEGDRAKACKSEAGQKGLKGDARKTFMADCLKG